jgi:hypothetical protein
MKKSLSLIMIFALLSVLGAGSLVSAQDVELTLWVYDDGRLGAQPTRRGF